MDNCIITENILCNLVFFFLFRSKRLHDRQTRTILFNHLRYWNIAFFFVSVTSVFCFCQLYWQQKILQFKMIFNNFKIRFGTELKRTEEICLHKVDFFLVRTQMRNWSLCVSQSAFACANFSIETLEQGVNYVQS